MPAKLHAISTFKYHSLERRGAQSRVLICWLRNQRTFKGTRHEQIKFPKSVTQKRICMICYKTKHASKTTFDKGTRMSHFLFSFQKGHFLYRLGICIKMPWKLKATMLSWFMLYT